jgi:dTDP-4-amino-4,6-dideoxygalactose transaminase
MDFIDLAAQQRRIKEKIDANIQKVLKHGSYIMGPEIQDLEGKLAAYAGVKHAISCASGTDALLMALMAYRIGPGDAVLTTPFTFIATAEVISLLGAVPVFVDIDPDTFNISPERMADALAALDVGGTTRYPMPKTGGSSKLTPRGIIAVDLFGLAADYDRINALARQHQLFVIEDAAQSFGAEYYGRKACSLADVACTSFFPAKPLGCYGDGGMCFTDDDDLANAMRSIRIHGQGGHKYENARIGINGRLDTLQAAILLAKLEIFPEEIGLRQDVARRYTEGLSSYSSLRLPIVPPGYLSVWAQYSILAADAAYREICLNRLKEAKIPSAIYYPKPLHLQGAFADRGYRIGGFPVSESSANRIFSLPMHPYLKENEQARVLTCLRYF